MSLWTRVITPTFLLLLAVNAGFAAAGVPAATNHFQFRLPRNTGYRIDENDTAPSALASGQAGWLKAWPDDGSTNWVELSSRVVLQILPGQDPAGLLKTRPLTLSRTVAPGIYILQAPDAWTAAQQADELARLPGVTASLPVIRHLAALDGPYAPMPNDEWWIAEFYLERRNADGSSAGMDLNTRAAWPFTMGQGVTIALADTGVELTHPEFTNRAAAGPHYNFADGTTNAGPEGRSSSFAHGTEVAGLALAEANNSVGMAGVAPAATPASWVIFQSSGALASDEQLMDMYQYSSNSVSVQNHSWGHTGVGQTPVSLLEQIGISNAVANGRFGLGSIMVRAAGNDRAVRGSPDDDGYTADPRVVVVAAARLDGRATYYSEPGASVLVGAPSGDNTTPAAGLFTTDLLGTDGVDIFNFFPPHQDWNNYAFFNNTGFAGTSASAPQVSGVAALILSANPGLTYRDVQQILILSSRHFDLTDPDLVSNAAGFLVSHNLGFGIPDAGAAVQLARAWPNRPPPTIVTLTNANPAAIPDGGLRVLTTGAGVPPNLASVFAYPGFGLQADNPTASLPLVDVGTASSSLTNNLTSRAALIQRGASAFSVTISNAAAAGAAFAVIYNNAAGTASCAGGDQLCPLGGTDFSPIPAVFIGQTDGENLRALLQTNAATTTQIRLFNTNYVFTVTNTLVCEQVGVRLQTDHPLRGDLRITLVSPGGTRSVLQNFNTDTQPGPVDWTYYSTHFFFESSFGDWRLEVADESPGAMGNVLAASLILQGVAIKDTDHDGLDDDWEMAHFGTLAYGPKDDPDKDGYSNAREQLMGTDPAAPGLPFPLDLSPWNSTLSRLSWPGSTNYNYQVWSGTSLASLTLLTNVPGRFPETEWFTPSTVQTQLFFRVKAVPAH